MKDLTFGEQVKIILSRKGMTIKELAELIQEETGKAMSRQNLTQRLGRDNFQEQDMRLIASILGCPFRLSIFPTESDEGFNIDTEAMMNYAKKSGKKKKEKAVEDDEVYQQEFIFDETMTASVATEPVVEEAEEPVEEAAEVEEETVWTEAAEEPVEEAEEVVEEAEEVVEEAAEVEEEQAWTEAAEEPIEEAEEETEQDITIGEFYEMQEAAAEEPIEEIEEPEPVKPDRFRTGTLFLRGFGRNKNKKNKKEKREEKREEKAEKIDVVEEQPVVEKKPRPVITPDSEEFEPVLRHQDEEEDLNVGELNPYTGREYQSNSVRMHPSKIGYVQVYDRAKHGWTDMTEWAFLGYQEEKKKLLGRDYEPPIYLD